jgi:hypothetical protein
VCNGCMHISYNHVIIFIPVFLDMGCCYGCSYDVKHPKADSYTGGHSSAGCLSSTYHSYGPREDLGVTAAQVRMKIYFLASYC